MRVRATKMRMGMRMRMEMKHGWQHLQGKMGRGAEAAAAAALAAAPPAVAATPAEIKIRKKMKNQWTEQRLPPCH